MSADVPLAISCLSLLVLTMIHGSELRSLRRRVEALENTKTKDTP